MSSPTGRRSASTPTASAPWPSARRPSCGRAPRSRTSCARRPRATCPAACPPASWATSIPSRRSSPHAARERASGTPTTTPTSTSTSATSRPCADTPRRRSPRRSPCRPRVACSSCSPARTPSSSRKSSSCASACPSGSSPSPPHSPTRGAAVARLATGRERTVVFNGHYHGHIPDTLRPLASSHEEDFLGLPGPARARTTEVEYNDLDGLSGRSRAATRRVLIEPALTNFGLVLPADGFHQGTCGSATATARCSSSTRPTPSSPSGGAGRAASACSPTWSPGQEHRRRRADRRLRHETGARRVHGEPPRLRLRRGRRCPDRRHPLRQRALDGRGEGGARLGSGTRDPGGDGAPRRAAGRRDRTVRRAPPAALVRPPLRRAQRPLPAADAARDGRRGRRLAGAAARDRAPSLLRQSRRLGRDRDFRAFDLGGPHGGRRGALPRGPRRIPRRARTKRGGLAQSLQAGVPPGSR